jgi:anti-anti-sigma factor
MSVQTETKNGVTIVSFCGCLLCDSGALEDTLRHLASQGARILLDLAKVEHLNSRTIGLLVAMHQAAARHGGAFWTCNLNTKSMKLLSALKLSDVLQVFESREAALRSIADVAQRSAQRSGAGSSPLA